MPSAGELAGVERRDGPANTRGVRCEASGVLSESRSMKRFFLSLISDEDRLLHRENAYLRERYRQKVKETIRFMRSMKKTREHLEAKGLWRESE